MEVLIFPLFLMTAAMLFMLFVVLGKLSRLEETLRERGKTPPEKPAVLPASEKPVPPPPVPEIKPAPEKPAVVPPPPPPPPPPAPRPPRPPRQEPAGETLFAGFWRWFCVGSRRENVSTEYAAATTWLMRAGVLILLCGVGFFLKYSIENDLVSPPVRITMTYLAGLAMFGAGLYGLNKRFHVLAAGILAAGVVTLYMGSFAGYRLYKLVPVEAAFALMVLTTAAGMHRRMALDFFCASLRM